MTENRSRAELLAAISPEQRAQIVTSPEEMAALEFDWSFWGRPKQHAPAGNWSNWLILAGRGFGKTRTGAEWVRQNMCGDTPLTGGRWRHIAIIAETAANARDVMVGDGKEPSNLSAGSASTAAHAGAAAAIWAAPSPNDSRRARRNPDVDSAITAIRTR